MKGHLHGVNECIAGSLAEVKVFQLFDNVIMQCACLQEINQLLVERGFRFFAGAGLAALLW